METEANLREALPEDVLCSILARLPVRVLARMRTVCKRWKSLLSPGNALQKIDPIFSVNSMPGFFIQLSRGPQDLETWVIELGHSVSAINIYKSPVPSDQIVVDACQSICCYCIGGDILYHNLSIGNPATRTCRQLPRPPHIMQSYSTFHAMSFDATSRRCTVLLGGNNVDWHRQENANLIALQIYDSESNAWTRVFTRVPRFMQPYGRGLYSKGKFYWIIQWNVMYFMVAFSISKSSWTEIALPEGSRSVSWKASLRLSGCDGQVMLIENGEEIGSIRMWRLNESEDAAEWCELHDISRPKRQQFFSVVANSGWTMMVNREMEIYVCNSERKLTKKISLPGQFGRYPLEFLSAFESNNVWWP